MRAICYTCPGYGLYEVPRPKLTKPDDVMVRVAYAGICGSDLNIIRGFEDEFLNAVPGEKMVLGHEASGYIAEIGPEATVKGLKVGDKVAIYYNEHCGKCYYCRNGQEQFCEHINLRMGSMADYIALGEQQVFKLEDDADMLEAAMIEPVSVVLRGIDLCHIKPGTKAAVSGGGGIGLLFVQLLRQCGCSRITVIEPVEEKRKTAMLLGADDTIDPFHENSVQKSMEITEGRGFDVVIETSGVLATIQSSYEILGRGGTLELFACYPKNSKFPLDLESFFSKEARIVGVFQSPYMYPRTMEMYKRIDLTPFTRNVYMPEQWKEAFEYRKSGVPQKIIFDFT